MDVLGFSAQTQSEVAEHLDNAVDEAADFEVMPDAWPAVRTFLMFQTQWRHSFNGITGLDYTPLIPYLQKKFRKDWERELQYVQIIEFSALTTIQKLKSARNGQ
jgi:hypothetical protein